MEKFLIQKVGFSSNQEVVLPSKACTKNKKNFSREELVELVGYIKEHVVDFTKCPPLATFEQYCLDTNAPRSADSYKRKYQSLLRRNELTSYLKTSNDPSLEQPSDAPNVNNSSNPMNDDTVITTLPEAEMTSPQQDTSFLLSSSPFESQTLPEEDNFETNRQPRVSFPMEVVQPLSPTLMEMRRSLTRCHVFGYMCEILDLPIPISSSKQ